MVDLVRVRGKLPDRHREWVLNDATCRTWWLRHVARSLVQLTPVAILLLVVLGANQRAAMT